MKACLNVFVYPTLQSIVFTKKCLKGFVTMLTLTIWLLSYSFIQSQIFKKGTYSIGYLNESISRPGLIIGGEWLIKQWEKEKINKRKQTPLIKERALIINPQIGLYHHVKNHHHLHHHVYEEKAFGVSSPIWDFIFGTLPPKGRIERKVKN